MKNKSIENCFEGKSEEFRKAHKIEEIPIGINLCTLPVDYKKVCKEMGMRISLGTYVLEDRQRS